MKKKCNFKNNRWLIPDSRPWTSLQLTAWIALTGKTISCIITAEVIYSHRYPNASPDQRNDVKQRERLQNLLQLDCVFLFHVVGPCFIWLPIHSTWSIQDQWVFLLHWVKRKKESLICNYYWSVMDDWCRWQSRTRGFYHGGWWTLSAGCLVNLLYALLLTRKWSCKLKLHKQVWMVTTVHWSLILLLGRRKETSQLLIKCLSAWHIIHVYEEFNLSWKNCIDDLILEWDPNPNPKSTSNYHAHYIPIPVTIIQFKQEESLSVLCCCESLLSGYNRSILCVSKASLLCSLSFSGPTSTHTHTLAPSEWASAIPS